jgi:Lon protease-like protein
MIEGMSEDLLFDGEKFCGRARVFPLPNLVMFPHVVQPLHIFEPRYRELMEDALAADKLIAMAVLAEGWEADYEGRPKLHPVACLGRIATHERLPDGRFNLLLLGLRRVRLVHELPPERLYREAESRLLDDDYPSADEPARADLHARLLTAFRRKVEKLVKGQAELEKLLNMDMLLGTLTDLVGYTLDFDVAFKARLLKEVNVDRRAEALLAQLEGPTPVKAAGRLKFPPDFSPN